MVKVDDIMCVELPAPETNVGVVWLVVAEHEYRK